MSRRALWLAATAALLPLTVQAQSTLSSVVFDGSTGPAVDAPTRPLPGGGTEYLIDHCPSCPGDTQGRPVGKNLFFGLLELSVGEIDEATIMNSDASGSFDNVFAKVSGNERSEIFGVLRSEIPEADLFLLNPNGVIFGESAELDVKGSFYVTTANTVNFDNGQVFEASLGGSIPTVEADPVSFGFLLEAGHPKDVTFAQTRNLGVGEGKTLSAVAGDVYVAGRFQGETFATLQSSQGVIQLAAVPAGTTVPLDVSQLDVAGFDPDVAAVRITDDALVQVDGAPVQGQGRIVIRGGSFQIVPSPGFVTSPEMKVFAGGAGEQPAIDVQVAGEVTLDGATIASVASGSRGSGDVSLVGSDISLDNESLVEGAIDSNPSLLTGPGIHLEATSKVEIQGVSRVQTHDDANFGLNRGPVGSIRVISERLTLSGSRPASQSQAAASSEISTVSSGRGDTGTIRVDASGAVTLEQGARIAASRRQGFFPVGTPTDLGAIEIFADSLELSGGAQIISDTEADIGGAGIFVGSEASPLASLSLRDGTIVSQTRASGSGGDVTVHAGDIFIENTDSGPVAGATAQIGALTSRTSPSEGGDGPGGNVTIRADSMTLRNGGQLRAVTDGSARGGDFDIRVSGTFLAEGEIVLPDAEGNPGQGESIASGVFARSALYVPEPGAGPAAPTTGSAGRIDIVADQLALRAGGLISARAEGTGAGQSLGGAGDVHVVADTVTLEGAPDVSSEISTKGAGGDGGNLTIDAEQLTLRNGGIVSASGTGAGDSGDLEVNASRIDIEGAQSGIYAQSLGVTSGVGKAGNITLAPPDGGRLSLRVAGGGQISAESRVSEAGTIRIIGADRIELVDGGRISTIVGNVLDIPANQATPSDISIIDAGEVLLSNGIITAETTGNVNGGTISIDAETVELTGGSEITANSSSTSTTEAGDAGSIVITAADAFEASDSRVTTTAVEGGGGRISIQAGRLVYLFDSEVQTTVRGSAGEGDAGDIDIPLRGDEGSGVDPTIPEFIVINRSKVIANAELGDAGNITITGQDVFISEGSRIEASSRLGVNGVIRVTSPDGDVVGQVTPLPADFSDPSDRLLPPCVARTERTGSFVVQKSEAPPAAPDGPLSPALGGAGGALPARQGLECSMPEEST